MNRLFLFFSLGFIALGAGLYAQNNFPSNIDYWIGSGPNEVILVIDFNDGSLQESWAFPYRFEGELTAHELLEAIASDYPKFIFTIEFGFLGNIYFESHVGIAGSPDYWNTFDHNGSSWISNEGLTKSLQDGDWFGCSYTGVDTLWNPIFLPDNFDFVQTPFTADSILQVIGTGNSEAVIVIDFNSQSIQEAFAWKLKFSDNLTALDALGKLTEVDLGLSFNLLGEFINDIIYHEQEGLGANPFYWATFSGTGLHDWSFNTGLSEVLNHNDWYGFSYTDFDADFIPIHLPANPVAANFDIQITPARAMNQTVLYPNPATSMLFLPNTSFGEMVEIVDLNGKVVLSDKGGFENTQLDLSLLIPGQYIIVLRKRDEVIRQSFVKL